ncbi:hypothetical protein KEM60_01563 [Austwickia sp. TVS 96-490-7B]|uniref:MarR family winged helix-turn-helix transcriptional regulator n=1 Tax=Austwickia sp. TVS 96-490-7B TaxID=2830843 RepID=UPI001C588164|nr:MarR family transcriptional regulator [Austwickia sp. TVS 96-490-7B]MBW3085366.1 hypothetical protein [Austwickia sp. TVS 96-490-7B]
MPTQPLCADADPTDERATATAALRAQLVHFKRTLHLLRTATPLHHTITPSGVPVLGLLARLGPSRTTALAAELGLDPSTVSRQVDALVRTGHVEKIRDTVDKRATLVQPTDLGRASLQAHVDTLHQLLQGLLDDWDTPDIDTLTTLLGRLNDDVMTRFAAHPCPSSATAADIDDATRTCKENQ